VAGAAYTSVAGVDDAGWVAGTYRGDAGGSHAFIRDAAGTITTFDVPGAGATYAGGISAGEVAGTYDASGHSHGFIRDAAGNFTLFDAPDSINTFVYGFNDGRAVGSFLGNDGIDHGFVRDAAGDFTLVDVSWSAGYTEVTGINSLGQLTGDYLDGNDYTSYAFVASLAAVPEPGSLTLLAIGVAAVLGRRFRSSPARPVSREGTEEERTQEGT
jgi:hypothetical protein